MREDPVDERLAQWARERPDLDTAPMAVFARIHRISQASAERVARAYGRHGINRADFDVLATLRRAGEPFELSPGGLAGSLMLSSAGMTGRLDRLERTGLVERRPDPADRRGVIVRLTPEGRAVVDRAVADGLASDGEILAALEPRERETLATLLRKLLLA